MICGDLVRVKLTDPDPRGRTSGIILEFDTYKPTGPVTPIAEVHWCTGARSWIAIDRIELINVTQEIDELALSLADTF